MTEAYASGCAGPHLSQKAESMITAGHDRHHGTPRIGRLI
jgi:hypothetical protein